MQWQPKHINRLLNAQHRWRFFIEELEIKITAIDSSNDRVQCRYPSIGQTGWSDISEFEGREVIGELKERINPEFDGSIGCDWAKGWRSRQWTAGKGVTRRSPTNGIWAIHRTSMGITLTHLPSGMAAVERIPSKKRAKHTARMLEARQAIDAQTVEPVNLWEIANWARSEESKL